MKTWKKWCGKDRFREDLYYRIHVVPIFVPALRERVEDIPVLADYFVSVYCAANGFPAKRIADDAMLALKRYPWPGNVRELENAIQRLVIMTDGDMIMLKDLPAEIVQAVGRDPRGRFRLPSSGIKLDKEIEAFERRWIAGGAGAVQEREGGGGESIGSGPEPAELPLPEIQSVTAGRGVAWRDGKQKGSSPAAERAP